MISSGKSAIAYSALEAFGRVVLQFALSLILARLLSVEEFGLMAMLAIIVGLANNVVDGGFGAAIVQRQHFSQDGLTTVFAINVLLGAVLAGISYWLSPFVAAFFREPVLEQMLEVLSATFVISGLCVVPRALFIKQMDFKVLFFVSSSATAIAGCVAVTAAYAGLGVWSLVWQSLVFAAVTCVSLYAFSSWRPTGRVSAASVAPVSRFGSVVLGTAMLETVVGRFYALVIGRSMSAEALGLYSRSESTRDLPMNLLQNVFARVAFPWFARAQGDQKKVREALRRAIQLTVLINTPIMICVSLLSADVLSTLFGSKWVGAAPSLTGLALAGALWPVALLNLTYTKAMGHTRRYLNLELKRKVLIIVSVLCAAPFGLTAIAFSQLVVNGLCVVIFTRCVEQALHYGLTDQLRENAKTIAGTICMVLALVVVVAAVPTGGIDRLFFGMLVGSAVYVSSAMVLRNEALIDFKQTLEQLLRSRLTF